MKRGDRVLGFTVAGCLVASSALADPGKVLVLQADGRADGKTRTKVHAAVLKLAKASGGAQIAPGDITYADAAAAVGCKPEAVTCKDEVLGMLAVDEIVITHVTPKPGGLEVEVRRVAKGGATKEAKALVAVDRAEHLDAIAPLFASAATQPASSRPVEPTKPEPVPAKPDPTPPQPPTAPPPDRVAAEPAATTQSTDAFVLRPQIDGPPKDRSKLAIGGMAVGATMLVVGAALWAKASSVQSDINEAPTNTAADLLHLQELESMGDSYAGWGNALAMGGLVVGGVSTYLFFRNRSIVRAHDRAASLVPMIVPGGAGLTFTLGGLP